MYVCMCSVLSIHLDRFERALEGLKMEHTYLHETDVVCLLILLTCAAVWCSVEYLISEGARWI